MGVRAPRKLGGSKSPAVGSGARSRQPRAAGARPATDVPAILQAIARTAARLCDAADAHIYRVEGHQLRVVAIHGSLSSMRRVGQTLPITPRLATGRAVLDRRTIHLHDITTAAVQRRYPGFRDLPRATRTFLIVPLLRDDLAVGLIAIRRLQVRPFTARQIALLRTFADQAAIALENERLRETLEARNRELTEGLERETATGEILRIISRSLTDVQPVLEAIVESATRLCDASIGSMARFDGHLLTLPVLSNASMGEREAASRVFPMAPTTGTAAGRAILERRIIHIHDVRLDSEYTATPVQQPTLGYRTVLSVPLLREGEPIGALVMWRREVKPFSQKQIDLMTTFADQAVIAIENVRLFTELEVRNRDLTESLEQQMATGEILRVISSSPTDVQPVFDTIVESALRLCEGVSATVYRFDGRLITSAPRTPPSHRKGARHSGGDTQRRPAAAASWPRRFSTGPSSTCATSSATPTSPRPASRCHVRRSPKSHLHTDAPRGVAHRCHRRRAAAEGPGRSPISEIHFSRRSPTRPSSPSRTSACSRNWRPATATSPRPWSSRPPPARSCGSSRARRPMSSLSSTRSPSAPCNSVTRARYRLYHRRRALASVAAMFGRRMGVGGDASRVPDAARAPSRRAAGRSGPGRRCMSPT